MTLADRVVVLRDGLIEQVGSPLELYDRPANQFVAQFIGTPQMNMVAPRRCRAVRRRRRPARRFRGRAAGITCVSRRAGAPGGPRGAVEALGNEHADLRERRSQHVPLQIAPERTHDTARGRRGGGSRSIHRASTCSTGRAAGPFFRQCIL
jgi:ABC-type proline/glycine betaine transport system ATPase subunit